MLHRLKKFISAQFIFPKVELSSSTDMEKHVVIVTGASKGVGRALVETLLSQGASVVAASRHMADLELAFPMTAAAKLLLVEADVTAEESVQRLVTKAIDKFGRVDVLINNAGINIESPLDQMSLESFSAVVNTNLTGLFLMCREVLPHMKQAHNGLIINIGSKISHNTNVRPNKVAYATTKSAIESFSFALNKELKESGLRVMCLMPGTINTFVSTHAHDYMSPYEVAEVALMAIKLKTIDFEGIVFKSKNQDI